MKITLEMVDEVINRTNVSYKVAKEALELSDGDVLKAILHIESQKEESADKKSGSKKVSSQEIIERLKALVNEGLVHQIIVEKNGRVIVDIPVVAGALSAVIFTWATVAGIVAALATGCELKILKKDGDIINFNELTQEKFDDFMTFLKKEKKDAQDAAKDAAEDFSDAVKDDLEKAEDAVDAAAKRVEDTLDSEKSE
ncbi:MAG: hypothetical protein PWQ12_1830 [Clostridiales bacterium]|jgi:NACalpha-BTF3-like transcription factor|nr:hypothetical protein [Clostridiales bacterium]